MKVRHNGAFSDTFQLPAGGCQGTNLGILNFLVTVNSCGVSLKDMTDCLCNTHIGSLCHPVLPSPPPHITADEARFKYIDDMAQAEAVKLSNL